MLLKLPANVGILTLCAGFIIIIIARSLLNHVD